MDLKDTVDRLESKLRLLQEKHRAFGGSSQADRKRIEELLDANEALTRRIASLEAETGYLKAVHTLAPSREEAAAVRTMLAGLVREIDRCIVDLGE